MTIALQDNWIFPVPTRARILGADRWDTGGTVAVSSTADGAFASAPTDSETYQWWEPETTSAETWTYTLSEATDCTCIALVYSGVTDLKVEYYTDEWVTLHNDTVPDQSPFMGFFDAEDVTDFRVTFTGGGRLYVARIGEAIVMPQMIYGGHSPIDLSRNVTTVTSMSAAGSEYLGRTVISGNLSSSFSWDYLKPKWVRETWYPFMKAAETDTFFIAWRPDYGSAQENEAAYVITASMDAPSNSGTGKGLMSVGFSATARMWDDE